MFQLCWVQFSPCWCCPWRAVISVFPATWPFLLPFTCSVPSSCPASHQLHKSLAVGIIFLFLQHLAFVIPHLSEGLEALPAVNTSCNDVYFFLPLQFSFSSVTSFSFFFKFFLSNLLNFISILAVVCFQERKSLYSFRLSQSSALQTVIISCNTHTSTHICLVTEYLTAFQMLGEVFAFNKWKKPATVDFIKLIFLSLIKESIPHLDQEIWLPHI